MPHHFSWKRMSLILILGKQSQFMGKIQNKKMILFYKPLLLETFLQTL